MAVYYIMFLSLGAHAGIIAFLLGFVFASFFSGSHAQANKPNDLALWTEMYFVLAIPLLVVIGAGIYFGAPSGVATLKPLLKVCLSIAAVVLLCVSCVFGLQLFRNRPDSARLRWCITFGPIICSGLVGIAGVLLALSSFGILSDDSWWLALVLLTVSLVPWLTALILFILLPREKTESVPPPSRHVAT